ncbi:MAG: hypothetical protein ACI8X5_002527 [Planctomycetota bacterium]
MLSVKILSALRNNITPTACALVGLAGIAIAQSVQVVTFNDTPANLLVLTNSEPGEIVNCFEVHFPEAGLYAMVPDKPANDAEFTTKMRAIAKHLSLNVVLTPGNFPRTTHNLMDEAQ